MNSSSLRKIFIIAGVLLSLYAVSFMPMAFISGLLARQITGYVSNNNAVSVIWAPHFWASTKSYWYHSTYYYFFDLGQGRPRKNSITEQAWERYYKK
jgi:hypothetical protein